MKITKIIIAIAIIVTIITGIILLIGHFALGWFNKKSGHTGGHPAPSPTPPTQYKCVNVSGNDVTCSDKTKEECANNNKHCKWKIAAPPTPKPPAPGPSPPTKKCADDTFWHGDKQIEQGRELWASANTACGEWNNFVWQPYYFPTSAGCVTNCRTATGAAAKCTPVASLYPDSKDPGMCNAKPGDRLYTNTACKAIAVTVAGKKLKNKLMVAYQSADDGKSRCPSSKTWTNGAVLGER